MKTISAALKTHLAGTTTSICTCWLITRADSQVFAFTDHDQNIVYNGVTYEAETGYNRTAINSNETLAVDNVDVVGLLSSSAITEHDMRAGLFDYATVQIFMLNWANLSQGILRLRSGWLGEVIVTPTGTFRTEIRGLTQILTMNVGEAYTPLCRADLGDSRCTVSIPTGTGTVVSSSSNSAFTAEGISYSETQDEYTATVAFTGTATNTLVIAVTIAGVTLNVLIPESDDPVLSAKYLYEVINDNHTRNGFGATATLQQSTQNIQGVRISKVNATDSGSVVKTNDFTNEVIVTNFAGADGTGDGYLTGGAVTWLSGQNAGLSMEIKSYAAGAVQLFLSMPFPIQAGDTFNWSPGCDKSRTTCYYKFDNMINFRGEPDLPGIDVMLSYPDAS